MKEGGFFDIRKWCESDCRRIAEMEKECFSEPWTLEMIEGSFCEEHFSGFVAEVGGEIIGYVGVSAVFDTVDVLLIAVSKEFRKRGVATALLSAATEDSLKCGAERAMLEVDVKNESAVSCYLKFGFKKIAERRNYYGEGKDAYIMEKRLLNDL